MTLRNPEQIAREKIDRLLEAAGWVLQDYADFNRKASLGVAVREFSMFSGLCDYLLFIEGKAAGVIEAKKVSASLSGFAEQSEKYTQTPPEYLECWGNPLPYHYESTGEETWFRDQRDPKARSRLLFAFHRPETLLDWIRRPKTLRARLCDIPPLDPKGLRSCQVEAITHLEESFAKASPRALIQLATGAGKTFTACSFSYRLIRHAEAKRILFLVDRNNLGDQTLREYQNYRLPDTERLFTNLYNVQHLRSNRINPDAKVVITTIQRLYSLLRGEELDEESEEVSGFEGQHGEDGALEDISYNPDIPIEEFDFIITDECHRSIYGLWRQVLEYFDAFIIGLTATPSKHTLGFFNQNLVAEYPYERSVADGVNVGYEIYRIRTRVTEEGGKVEASEGFEVPVRDKRTRKIRYEKIDDDLDYKGTDLDRSVVNPNQIRTVVQTYKERVFEDLFPERKHNPEWLPKTLIFAKDDNHAEEIVNIVREVFNEGNPFAKKITYAADDPKALIKAFRIDQFPRVAVTVDMIATGTDIRPVEVLIFMRDVKSESYYEQMKGRGVRTLPDTDLQTVTPNATTKTRFILIDAVGVSESNKNASQPLERKKGVSFEKLLEQIAMGRRDEDGLSSLAGRLAVLDSKLGEDDRARIMEVSGKSLRDLSNGLLDAIEPEKCAAILEERGIAEPTEKQKGEVIKEMMGKACLPFDDPKTRNLLKELKKKTDIVIDDVTTDEVVGAGFDKKHSEKIIKNFRAFIEENRDELTALQILYNRPWGQQQLTHAGVRELVEALTNATPIPLTTVDVWQAYRRLDASKVRGDLVEDQLTEVVSLVRFALGQAELLEPFGKIVEQRFNLWMGREKRAGREYTQEQEMWLRAIAEVIAANVEVSPGDFQVFPSLSDKGGILRAREVLGSDLDAMLADLQQVLVA